MLLAVDKLVMFLSSLAYVRIKRQGGEGTGMVWGGPTEQEWEQEAMEVFPPL